MINWIGNLSASIPGHPGLSPFSVLYLHNAHASWLPLLAVCSFNFVVLILFQVSSLCFLILSCGAHIIACLVALLCIIIVSHKIHHFR